MLDLPEAVEDLARAATSETDPRKLRKTVERVLNAFGSAPDRDRDAALRSIGRALGKTEGPGAQVLCLALGALVEAGASPELAWPAVERDLEAMLDRATSFASALVREAKDPHVETAIETAGAAVAKKKPSEAAAWKALPSRCLAAVACLTRSKELRAKARKDDKLVGAAWRLSDVVSEVGYLLQALRIVDDETVLVVAPAAGRGWRVAIDSMPSNMELYVLLADALIGEQKKGGLPGKRPNPKAIAAIREGVTPKKGAVPVVVPFQLVSWTAVESDGSLPPLDPDATDHWIWMEGVPADIPALGDQCVVLLQEALFANAVPVAPSFEDLEPDLRVLATLSPSEVVQTMIKLARAASKMRPAPSKTAKKKTAKTAKKKVAKTAKKKA